MGAAKNKLETPKKEKREPNKRGPDKGPIQDKIETSEAPKKERKAKRAPQQIKKAPIQEPKGQGPPKRERQHAAAFGPPTSNDHNHQVSDPNKEGPNQGATHKNSETPKGEKRKPDNKGLNEGCAQEKSETLKATKRLGVGLDKSTQPDKVGPNKDTAPRKS